MGWFDTCGASELSTMLADLTGKLNDGITRRVGDICQYITQFLFAFGAALYLSWKLTVVLLAAFPLIAVAGTLMIKAVASAQNESSDQYAQAGGLATETLKSIRTVSSLNSQPEAIERYRQYIFKALGISLVKSLKVGFFNGLTFMISFMTYALGFWYGASLIADSLDTHCRENCLTGGTVIAVFFSVIIGSTALGQVSPPLSAFSSAKAAAHAMLEVVNRKPLIDGLSDEGLIPNITTMGAIEVNNLNFCYPSRPNLQVCNGYSLSVKPGETVALCGPSGAGANFITFPAFSRFSLS